MIVRDLAEANTTRRRVVSKGWESTRLLLKDDAMGFSFHITTIYAGAELPMHYQNHLESVYCISGEGSIEDRETGERTRSVQASCTRSTRTTATSSAPNQK